MKIEDYALIGDCQTAALVNRTGSIDWLCWPNFGSDACFARILGDENNGFWSMTPVSKSIETTRRYQQDTLILETTHRTRTGAVKVVDFMPIVLDGEGKSVKRNHSRIVRMVTGLEGKVHMQSELALRFSYGATIPWVERIPGGIRAVAGPDAVELHTTVPLRGENMRTLADFTVSKGQTITFVLSCGDYADYSEHRIPTRITPKSALRHTKKFWCDWIGRWEYHGPYRELVQRSLLTLKALTFEKTGGIVAAPTTSLPEELGGERNWDYRYCWLRDTTFTLFAFLNSGFREEAENWMRWLRRTIAGDAASVQIMYGISGDRNLHERELPHLSGFANSAPVRVGNGAASQLQLDIYGEVIEAFFWTYDRLDPGKIEEFPLLCDLVQHLETIWMKPDDGIWEVRGGPRHFTYSKFMSWVAFDRMIQIAKRAKMRGPIARWEKIRDKIHREICTKAFNKHLNSFVQSYGSSQTDAALLIMVLAGFLPATDPRMIGTIEAIEKQLMRDGLLMRYNPGKVEDGLKGSEGRFLACSFWLASCLKMIGREGDALKLFARLAEIPNDVGLLSEEYDPRRKRFLGNFPQGFSHISLINAAYHLFQPEYIRRHTATEASDGEAHDSRARRKGRRLIHKEDAAVGAPENPASQKRKKNAVRTKKKAVKKTPAKR